MAASPRLGNALLMIGVCLLGLGTAILEGESKVVPYEAGLWISGGAVMVLMIGCYARRKAGKAGCEARMNLPLRIFMWVACMFGGAAGASLLLGIISTFHFGLNESDRADAVLERWGKVTGVVGAALGAYIMFRSERRMLSRKAGRDMRAPANPHGTNL